MENFRKSLKLRCRLLSIFAVVLVGIYVAGVFGLFEKISADEEYSSFFSGFQAGLFATIIAASIIFIAIYLRALKNDDKLKSLYIKENDERTRAVNEKSGKNLFKVSVFILIGAAVVSGYFNKVVFFTILGVVVFLEVVYNIMYCYYNRNL